MRANFSNQRFAGSLGAAAAKIAVLGAIRHPIWRAQLKHRHQKQSGIPGNTLEIRHFLPFWIIPRNTLDFRRFFLIARLGTSEKRVNYPIE